MSVTPLLGQRPRPDRSFERLYRRHVGDVYRYSLAMMRNPADAEDVTQTTFMNAYRAYAGGERPRAAQRWLITIAHNVCRQRFRQSQRRVEEVAYNDEIGDSLVADEQGPSAEDLRRALGQLAFNQRAALVMRELEGRSYAEIAEVLELSVSAVETLIFRARRALREQLEGRLTCTEAELAISRQLDGRLARAERGSLRAHLRECRECAAHARRLRAQRSAIKALGLAPLPVSLGSFFGGGSAAAAAGVGAGLAAKTAAVVAAGTVVAGVGVEASRHSPWKSETHEPKQVAVAAPAAEAADPPPVELVARTSAPSTARQSAEAPAAERAEHAAKRQGPKPGSRGAGPAKAQADPATSRRPEAPPGQTTKAAAAPTAAKPKKPQQAGASPLDKRGSGSQARSAARKEGAPPSPPAGASSKSPWNNSRGAKNGTSSVLPPRK